MKGNGSANGWNGIWFGWMVEWVGGWGCFFDQPPLTMRRALPLTMRRAPHEKQPHRLEARNFKTAQGQCARSTNGSRPVCALDQWLKASVRAQPMATLRVGVVLTQALASCRARVEKAHPLHHSSHSLQGHKKPVMTQALPLHQSSHCLQGHHRHHRMECLCG